MSGICLLHSINRKGSNRVDAQLIDILLAFPGILLALALIAGSDNIVSPKATSEAVLPAFIFLGVGMVLVAGAFAFLGIETHGRAIEDIGEAEAAPRQNEIALGTR